MNASNFEISAILSQLGENNLFDLVDFYSLKFSPMEINYEIHDIKLLAIMDAFEKWHHLLKGVQHESLCIQTKRNCAIFHNNSCIKSMPSLVGIILVMISICHHILP
jgi:hypothetical protein